MKTGCRCKMERPSLVTRINHVWDASLGYRTDSGDSMILDIMEEELERMDRRRRNKKGFEKVIDQNRGELLLRKALEGLTMFRREYERHGEGLREDEEFAYLCGDNDTKESITILDNAVTNVRHKYFMKLLEQQETYKGVVFIWNQHRLYPEHRLVTKLKNAGLLSSEPAEKKEIRKSKGIFRDDVERCRDAAANIALRKRYDLVEAKGYRHPAGFASYTFAFYRIKN